MKRRELLAGLGAGLGTATLGGCLGRYRDTVGGTGETRTTTAGERTTDDQPSETTAGREPALAGTSFEILKAGCGQPGSEASVEFREESVVVTGTIDGSNACYVAKLADASYDPETRTLDLTVVSTQKDGAQACSQCIVEIEYETTATFEGGLPETVRVVHEGMAGSKTVATATPDGASRADGASEPDEADEAGEPSGADETTGTTTSS